MPLVLLKGRTSFVIALKKIGLVKTVSEKGYWFFVHCLQQKRSWGCSFHKDCCKFYYHLDCGVSVLILRERPLNVRKRLCLLTAKGARVPAVLWVR